jgi:hypothetical protein
MPLDSGLVLHLSRHTLKQLKFLIPGGAITYWLDSYHEFLYVAAGVNVGWGRYVFTSVFRYIE